MNSQGNMLDAHSCVIFDVRKQNPNRSSNMFLLEHQQSTSRAHAGCFHWHGTTILLSRSLHPHFS